MGLRVRMSIAIALIFALMFAFAIMLVYILEYFGWIGGYWVLFLSLLLTLVIVLLQWGTSPYIIGWIFKIVWIGPSEGFPHHRHERMYRAVERMAQESGVAVPKVGIVPDDNPNAFAYGWTKNKAHLVLTNGIFKYCDDDEAEAVAAHEMGHIVHNDFVVMTVITAIVLTFYVIAIWSWRIGRMSGRSREGGNAAAAIAVIGAISFVMYLLANFISLLVSRYREYWADRYSGEVTKRPNQLSSALVKIAYGLASEGRGLDKDERNKQDSRHSNALMFFSASSARALAVNSTTSSGYLSKEAVKETMAWDLWNPWGFFYELGMTHPLPAKRILALNKVAEDQGQAPYISFDLEKPESYWDDFLKDIFARSSWIWGFPLGFLLWWFWLIDGITALGIALTWMSVALFLYLRLYHYPPGFKSAKVGDLLRDPKASPVKGQAVKLRGYVIGRGVPGLFYSEDLKIDDGSGLLLIDYRSILRIIDFFQGIFRTEQWVGAEVEVTGWFRRPVVPMLELLRMDGGGKSRKVYRPYIEMTLTLLPLLLGLPLLLIGLQ